MHYRLNGRQCLISVAPTASCWANATEDKSSLQSLPSFDCNLARTLWDHTGWLHLFWAGRFKDTWNLAGKHPQLNTHTTLPQTVSSSAWCFQFSCPGHRLQWGPTCKRSALTLQHASRHHKTTDTHAQTHTYQRVHRHDNKRACHSGGAHAQQALVGAEERALEPWQGVTNNCSSLDMQNGPTVNLPDWYSAVCCGKTACF